MMGLAPLPAPGLYGGSIALLWTNNAQRQLLKVAVLMGNEEGDSGDPAQGTKMPAAAQQPCVGAPRA